MLNSIVVILRSIATKNPYSCLFHKYRLSGGRAAASRSGGPQTSGCRRACPAGCGRPTPTALLCHPERSESTNAASAETACGLCQARRRETNEMQSRIYSEQGYRCFAALNMTLRQACPTLRLFLWCGRADAKVADLAPGPARIEDATPAADPGEHMKNKYC